MLFMIYLYNMGKESIPKTVKNSVWLKYMGKIFEGKCFCCGITNISVFNYVCGHVKSEKKGGVVCVKNLRPICASCNGSMGTKNMKKFMSEYGYDSKKFNKDIDSSDDSDDESYVTNAKKEKKSMKSDDKPSKKEKLKKQKIDDSDDKPEKKGKSKKLKTDDSDDESDDNSSKKKKKSDGTDDDYDDEYVKDDLKDVCNMLLLKYPDNKKKIISILINNSISVENVEQLINKFYYIKYFTKDELCTECVNMGILNAGLVKNELIKEILCCDIGIYSGVMKMKKCNNLKTFTKDELINFRDILNYKCSNEKSVMIKLFSDNFYTVDRLLKVRSTYNTIKNYDKNKLVKKCKQKRILNDGFDKDDLIIEFLRHAV